MSEPTPPQPFAAPCRDLRPTAALAWLAAGWKDFRASLGISLTYGVLVWVISAVVSSLAWWLGSYVLVLSVLSGFIFIAPLLATGLYSVCRQVRRGERASLLRSLSRMRKALGDAMVFALILMVIFLVWARSASMIHIFFPASSASDWASLLPFLAIGSAVGSIFATITFSAAAFSLPMIVDRDCDMVSACVSSINAVLRNKLAMMVWASLIVALTAIGFATAGLGLIVAVPLLAYATYHAYLETIDASQWPESPL